jgi:hypothetical protein
MDGHSTVSETPSMGSSITLQVLCIVSGIEPRPWDTN